MKTIRFTVAAPDLEQATQFDLDVPTTESELEDRYHCTMEAVFVGFVKREGIKVQSKIRGAWADADDPSKVDAQSIADHHTAKVKQTRREKLEEAGFSEDAIEQLEALGLI